MNVERNYDIIGYGDEVPGILAVVSAAREYRRRTSRYPSVLLMSKGPGPQGIGGHLVRGRLAYLDRSQLPLSLRQRLNLPTFGEPPTLYRELLNSAGVQTVALDPTQASQTLETMRRQAGVDLLTSVNLETCLKQGNKITGIALKRGETYRAKQFIDATVNAELAQAAGAGIFPGFATFGLPDSELSVTLVFETQGLSPARLKQVEDIYLRRFTNLSDREAQNWLQAAAGFDNNLATQLRQDMRGTNGVIKGMFEGNDYIDVRAPALSVAYHSFRGKPFSLSKSGSLLDKANIAKLSRNRLVWNALLFDVNASQANALALNNAQPTEAMLEEMNFVEQWFRSLGATAVTPASELYIRHAGNISKAVTPLSGTQMLKGGVPTDEGLGTFGYGFDIRGGIQGLGERANSQGFSSLSFGQPIFNIGIGHALLKDVPNLAVVSPASGFEGFAASAGRIVEHNAGVGQGVGIAAVIALLENRELAEITNAQVQRVMALTNKLPRLYGQTIPREVAKLEAFEMALVIRTFGSEIA